MPARPTPRANASFTERGHVVQAADRAKPLIMFEDLRFDTPEAALAAAEKLKADAAAAGRSPIVTG